MKKRRLSGFYKPLGGKAERRPAESASVTQPQGLEDTLVSIPELVTTVRQEPRYSSTESEIEATIVASESQADARKEPHVTVHELIFDKENTEKTIVLEDTDSQQIDSDNSKMESGTSFQRKLKETLAAENNGFTRVRAIMRLFLLDRSIADFFAVGIKMAISFDKLLDRLRACFLTYSIRLAFRAENSPEKDTAEFLKINYSRIATLLAKTIYTDDEFESIGSELFPLSPLSPQLERQLFRLDAFEEPIVLEAGDEKDSLQINADSGSQRDDLGFLDVEALEDFLMNGEPFAGLKKDLDNFVQIEVLGRSKSEAQAQISRQSFGLFELFAAQILLAIFITGVLYYWMSFQSWYTVLLLFAVNILWLGIATYHLTPINLVPTTMFASSGMSSTALAPLIIPFIMYEELDLRFYPSSLIKHITQYARVFKRLFTYDAWQDIARVLMAGHIPSRGMDILLSSVFGDSLDKTIQQSAVHLKRLFRPPLVRGFQRVEWICVSIWTNIENLYH